MISCPRCTAPVAPDAWFCSRCGLDLATARAGSVAPAPSAGAAPALGPVSRPPVPQAPPTAPGPWAMRPVPPPAEPHPGSLRPDGSPPPGPMAWVPASAAPSPAWQAAQDGARTRPSWQDVQQPMVAASGWAAHGWDQGSSIRAAGHTSGRITAVALAASVAASLLLLALALPLVDPDTWLAGFDGDRIDTVSSLGGVVSLVAAVATLCWMFQVTQGYAWLTGRPPQVGRIAAVVWWFVPLANFIMPPVTVNSLSRGLALPGRGRPAWLVPVWWVAFWLSMILAVLWDARLADLSEQFSMGADAFASATWLLLASEGLSVVAELSLIAIVVHIGRDAAVRQRAALGLLPWPPPPDVR